MYPLKFEPIYKERIWGGRKMASLLQRKLPEGKIGESWELSGYGGDVSRVVNGALAGKDLNELMKDYREKLLGETAARLTEFPLLIKIIDANDKLSLQVHPADSVLGNGKTEAWYVAEAEPGAQIIYGLKAGVDRARLEQVMQEGRILDSIKTVTVKKGDLVFVPAGMIHALLEGVVVYEVQQSSDTTYRLYDYDRVAANGARRELHIDQALDAVDFSAEASVDFSQPVHCPYFSLEAIQCAGEKQLATQGAFMILCITEGRGKIEYQGGSESVAAGETLLIPACLDQIRIIGAMNVLQIR
ncbi:type I phosphomannose isomerase catalytic subunit [Azotosporobacter soli]|uniref:type I phosphomannose isomerase catalytic subunit n=1 Tax=Azotosporobacter soli TaxID=3055040 RepID=UPI0031FE7FD1